MNENYAETKTIAEKILKFLDTMPHNSSLAGLLTDVLMNHTKTEERPYLLQLIVEKWKKIPSVTSTPMAKYKLSLDIACMEEFRNKANAKVKKLVDNAWHTNPVMTKVNFYIELYRYIFENEMFSENEHYQAYVLYICCSNDLLPYCELDKTDMKIASHRRCLEKEIGENTITNINFLLNHPNLIYLEKAALLYRELQSVPEESRDLLFEHIVASYEAKLKFERTITELTKNLQKLKAEENNKRMPSVPVGCSVNKRRFQHKKKWFVFHIPITFKAKKKKGEK